MRAWQAVGLVDVWAADSPVLISALVLPSSGLGLEFSGRHVYAAGTSFDIVDLHP